MQKPEMAISYSRDLGRPNWVSWHLTDEWVGSLTRVDTFRPDPEVPPTWYRVLASDFFASGFDRGHMTPNADRDKETSIPINQATFLMSNMVAQAPDNNQGPWADLEGYLRTLLPADELYIVSGPAGTGGTGSNGGTTTTIANGHVTVPASTWKCALVLPKASGDDVARVTASTRTICVIMPNIAGHPERRLAHLSEECRPGRSADRLRPLLQRSATRSRTRSKPASTARTRRAPPISRRARTKTWRSRSRSMRPRRPARSRTRS